MDILNSDLGGFRFRKTDGKKQVSIDGGSSWENFNRALSAFGQGEFLYSSLTNSLTLIAKQDYDIAFMAVSGATITISKITTSGGGIVTELSHSLNDLQLFGFLLQKIKEGDTVTLTSSTQARFNYAIWY